MSYNHWRYMVEYLCGTLHTDLGGYHDAITDQLKTDTSCVYVENFLLDRESIITYNRQPTEEH